MTSLRCIKILMLLCFINQSIYAQLPNVLGNSGCQSWPVPAISQNFNNQPVGSNFAADSSIPFTNTLLGNGNAPNNGLQTIPKLNFINGQIGELLNIASTINNKQLAINGHSAVEQNLSFNNNRLQIPSDAVPLNSLAPNNAIIPVNSIYPNDNNLLNNVPNNGFVSGANNLPVYNSALNCHLPENNNAPFSNLPINNPFKINSLRLTGEAFNNGLPFNVLPATSASDSLNNFPINTFVNNNVNANGLKLPRSLPSNEIENGYPIANHLVENNGISSWQSYNNEAQANILTNNVPLNSIVGNGLSVNNGSPFNSPVLNHIQSNGPAAFSSNDVVNYGMPYNNGEISSNIAMNNIYNAQQKQQFLSNNYQIPSNNEQFMSNNYQIPSNNEQFITNTYQIPSSSEWQQPLNAIHSYQNNELPIANRRASNAIFSQPTGSNFNLPDFANVNMLSLGEFGNYPVFSGLPVIGITETVSVINPEQFNQNQVAGF